MQTVDFSFFFRFPEGRLHTFRFQLRPTDKGSCREGSLEYSFLKRIPICFVCACLPACWQ